MLREGNSDRRAAKAVKKYAQQNPHKLKSFEKDSKTFVAYMQDNDFYANEQSIISDKNQTLTIKLNNNILKTTGVEENEIISSSFLSVSELNKFLQHTINQAKEQDLLWSIHLKATMMKVSDPVIFGEAVKVL